MVRHGRFAGGADFGVGQIGRQGASRLRGGSARRIADPASVDTPQLVTSAINKTDPNEPNQFASLLPWIIVILLVVAAVSQVYCLNKGLQCYDSTFTVPLFFATYTTGGFLNTLVYLDELHLYARAPLPILFGSTLTLAPLSTGTKLGPSSAFGSPLPCSSEG